MVLNPKKGSNTNLSFPFSSVFQPFFKMRSLWNVVDYLIADWRNLNSPKSTIYSFFRVPGKQLAEPPITRNPGWKTLPCSAVLFGEPKVKCETTGWRNIFDQYFSTRSWRATCGLYCLTLDHQELYVNLWVAKLFFYYSVLRVADF